ncbi:MAG: FAD-dependent oxidoreductase [Verrucomicrobiae bacterium]|nr:FAD-dependent oxidoreductase [Verrucomicrobiae bacterium]
MSESKNLPRRGFLRHSLGSAAGLSALGAHVVSAEEDQKAAPDQFQEPARSLPLADDADVIVCGAGPAGIAAALSAARAGAKTRLFEVHGCLGGVWTAGLLTYIFDFDKPGITREIIDILDSRGARRSENKSRFVYEPEEMKILLEELCAEAGVEVQLFTRVTAAFQEKGRLTTIVTESKAGRQAWRAPVFIDATGDGDLGALANCEWEIGQSIDCPCQPMTMNALAVVKDAKALGKYISFNGTDAFTGEGGHLTAVEAFKGELERAGIEASYGHPTIFHVRDDLVMLMLNHEYGIKPWDAAAITEATMRSRAEVFKIMRALRKLGGPWEGLQIAATAEQIGVRDGRRISGRYKVTREDLIEGARHEDAVTRATFGVDIHAPSKEANAKEPIGRAETKAKPYDIPLRALIAKDVDGLMMAGRCISGDFVAHASYRVTGNAVAMGEAAGAVAAIAAQSKRLPHEIDWSEGAALLEKTRRQG